MTRLRRGLLGAATMLTVAAGVALPAAARIRQPAVSCEVSDFSMELRFRLPLVRDGTGSPADGGMKGTLEIRHQKVPKERRLFSLDGLRPQQFWNRDDELKILLSIGAGAEVTRIVIETRRRRDETERAGQFRLTTPEVDLTGRVACQAP
jgi:hypothetical protein